jgi:hypothetical protein
MKHLAAILLFISLNASAQITPAANEQEGVEQAKEKCENGCLVLSREEVAAIEEALKREVQKAYEAGLRGWSTVAKD